MSKTKVKTIKNTTTNTSKPTKKTIITALVLFGGVFLILGFAIGICLGVVL